MKGLMRKELCLLRTGTGLLFVIASMLFAIGGGLAHDFEMAQCFAFMYVLLGTYSVMSMEEKWRWNTYFLCTPVTRFQAVLAKYIVTLGQLAVNSVIFIVVNLLSHGGSGLTAMLLQISMAFIIGSIMYPLVFRFGAEKGWIAAVFCVIMTMGMGAVAALSEDLPLGGVFGQGIFLWILLPVGLVLFGLSCPLSAKLYVKRK